MIGIRNEIKHIMRAVTVLATIFAMTFVLAGNANAIVIGPLDNPTVVQAPIGTAFSPIGVQPAINPFFSPPVFNPFFRPAAFNPFFRPPIFNPFFRPIFNPFLNPFFGADVDAVGVGLGVGLGAVD